MILPEHTPTDTSASAVSFSGLKAKKYSLLAVVYFFFNAAFLPKGLLYTHLLGPLFFYKTRQAGGKTWLGGFLLFLLGYDLVHLVIGVELASFLASNLLFLLTYTCVVGFYHFVNHYAQLQRLFRDVLLVNTVLVLLALVFLLLPRMYQEWFWYFNKLTKGVSDFPRLALFTYEASYYSLLLVPVVYYYLCKFFFKQFTGPHWPVLAMALVPLLLSFSFGVIGASLFAVFVLCVYFRKQLFRKKRAFALLLAVVLVGVTALVLVLWVFPDNFLAIRLKNIAAGTDTSTNGRTTDSFAMAWRIASQRSVWFGAGLGQVKVVNVEIVRKYFNYWGTLPRYDIPNAMGETLAIFGLLGVALRLALQIFLFVRTKVASNYYRFALFLFIFIYQFTGSFITNVVEYLIWVLAFSPVFPVFSTGGALRWGKQSNGLRVEE